jgi:hypothetical protein
VVRVRDRLRQRVLGGVGAASSDDVEARQHGAGGPLGQHRRPDVVAELAQPQPGVQHRGAAAQQPSPAAGVEDGQRPGGVLQDGEREGRPT